MIPKGLFAQIGMVLVAIAIVFTYVQPAFSKIGDVQDQISLYRSEFEKIVQVNDRLEVLVEKINTISREDERRLFNYMPDEVDSISVQRDLLSMVNRSGVLYDGMTYDGAIKPSRGEDVSETRQMGHSFSLSVKGTYSQIKKLLDLMVLNHYPLEVDSFDMTEEDGSFLRANFNLITYQYVADGVDIE